VKKPAPRKHEPTWIYRYVLAAVMLGLIEGVATFLFFSQACHTVLFQHLIDDPLPLIPYLFGMLFVAILALYLLIEHDAVNSVLFCSFILIWLVSAFALYYALATGCPMFL
jgi:glucan phosphoethanolaminetransferase (alkaline phosphatase superfamily)